MEEKILGKSEQCNLKRGLCLLFIITAIIGIIVFLVSYYDNLQTVEVALWKHPWVYGLDSDSRSAAAIAWDWSGDIMWITLGSVAGMGVVYLLIYAWLHSFEMTVSNKRIYGKAAFGKRVDLPLNSVFAIGSKWPKGVAVSTFSGKISFLMIKNRDEIHKCVSDLLIESKTAVTGQYDLNTAQGMDAYAGEHGYFYTGDTALKHIEPKTAVTGQYDLNTAQGMDAYAREHGYVYTGDTALKHFVVIQENLLPGEKVLMALAPNSVYNGNQIIMGGVTAVVFTNKRLIYGQKAILMGTPVKAVNLDNINDVQKDTFGLMNGKICIDTLKENVCFQFTKEKLDRIFVDVMNILENYRTSKTAPATAPAISNADELKKYKELLDSGVITQDEFDAKKKQLLGL